MNILFALTYYHPHLSGLTVYARRLAESLALRGHDVTVLASCHERSLPIHEMLSGVRIERVHVPFFIHKGAVMPSYIKKLIPLLRDHDVLSLHLPNTPIEASSILIAAQLFRKKPVVITYHCDLNLPKSVLNRLADFVVFLGNISGGMVSSRIVCHTDDYAKHSAFLRFYRDKLEIIPPPITISQSSNKDTLSFRSQHVSEGEILIGFATRFATEKGIEYLLEAIPLISKALNKFKILFVGEYQNVLGEQKYRKNLAPLLERYHDYVRFAGVLTQEDMAHFFTACDVTVLPSVNSTESFGMVQVESMLCGTPVVVSDIPGVRIPVHTTKMGKVVPPRDPEKLAEAIIDVSLNRNKYIFPRWQIENHYSLSRTVEQYENLFETLIRDYEKH